MFAFEKLKKVQLVERLRAKREFDQVLESLRAFDPSARVLGYPEAFASQKLVRKLWDALPEQYDAIAFESIEAQTSGNAIARFGEPTATVTLHLGWGMLAFSTTLHAAWHAWPRFAKANTDVFNACIYPDDLRWYVVRAGWNLYPMDCARGPEPVLVPG